MNKLLSLYVGHLDTVIPVLIVSVLALIFGALLFTFWKRDEDKPSSDMSAIEETLKKVLEATRVQPAQSLVKDTQATGGGAPNGTAEAAAPTAAGATSADVQAITAQIAEREKIIGDLKNKISELEQMQKQNAAGGSSADAVGLEARIKDLEARLKEYEIIEDDIANLSLYKEENSRLKDELSKAKGGEVTTPAADRLAEEMGLKPADKGESLEEALKKIEGENPAAPVLEGDLDAQIEAEILGPLTDAVAKLDGGTSAEPTQPDVDLVGQLANMMGQQSASELAAAPEAATAPAPEPAAQAAPAATQPTTEMPDVLKGFDPDKIAEEAGQLATQTEPVAADSDEGDPGLKLIEEFEKFSSDDGKKA